MAEHLLQVDHLQTVFHTREGLVRAVDDVSFTVDAGEIVSIVGESGSGKSVSMLSVLQLIQMPPGEITGGKALFEGRDLLGLKPGGEEMRRVRGGKVSMIFQEPMTSLNPVLTVGDQIMESVMLHLGYGKKEARARALELLELVGIPDGEERLGYYPVQFSGGMRQRVMIAMAMASDPKILIADEATTALDVTTQEQILDLLRDIVRGTGTALIIITHNLSVVARYADRIYVMYAGNVVERGTAGEMFAAPAHPYTQGLLQAIPRLDGDKSRPLVAIEGMPLNPAKKDGRCPFLPRCRYAGEACREKPMPPMEDLGPTHGAACWQGVPQKAGERAGGQGALAQKELGEELLAIRHVKKFYPVYKGVLRKKVADVKALDDVTFSLRAGETVGLVGESGCGKTTLAKSILCLHEITEGEICFEGRDITRLKKSAIRPLRRDIQFIFQDPYGSLDPRQTAGSLVGEVLKVNRLVSSKEEYDRRVAELFEAVGVDPALRDRMPHEFSGGQRQRLGIARALASNPKLVICDEPISALDVSIQAQIINLLIDLQKKRRLTYLFIAHDLSVVRHISDRIVVMYLGKVVEVSPWQELYEKPLHPYTRALLSAIPIPDPEVEKQRGRAAFSGEVPSLLNRPSGCVFHNRCPYKSERCQREAPQLEDQGGGHLAACFHTRLVAG